MVITAIYLHAPLDHTFNITSDIKAHRIDTALCHRKSIIINLAAMLKRSTLCNVTDQLTIFLGHRKVTVVREAICTIIKCHADRICALHRRETVILHNFLFGRCPVTVIFDCIRRRCICHGCTATACLLCRRLVCLSATCT